jgi:uncharacterized protein involved in outer membrane biogenesis
MIRRLFRWALYLFIIFVVLAVAAVLLFDSMVRSIAEHRVRAQTGMDVKIGKFSIGFFSPTITVENLKLYNTAEFGGGEFIDLPELHIVYDRGAIRSGKLHLNLVRLNLAEIHLVESKDGRRNFEMLFPAKQGGTGGVLRLSGGNDLAQMEFAGIDMANVTIERSRFTSFRQPDQNMSRTVGLKNAIYADVSTTKDLENVGATLALKSGLNVLLERYFGSPTNRNKSAGPAAGANNNRR